MRWRPGGAVGGAMIRASTATTMSFSVITLHRRLSSCLFDMLVHAEENDIVESAPILRRCKETMQSMSRISYINGRMWNDSVRRARLSNVACWKLTLVDSYPLPVYQYSWKLQIRVLNCHEVIACLFSSINQMGMCYFWRVIRRF
ncbi:hypothetical protein ZWY2020_043238 [Hordeum vulgare]|nr:hypothetical protein ZWY2020_043238 [Hordeum vulgare]